jgi:hypothetical protein
MPIRYLDLAKTFKHINVIVSCRKEEVEFYFQTSNIFGVCLDHDMPFDNGTFFAQNFLSERTIPVVISSHNHAGSRNILAILNDYETPAIHLPHQTGSDWINQVMSWFNNNNSY